MVKIVNTHDKKDVILPQNVVVASTVLRNFTHDLDHTHGITESEDEPATTTSTPFKSLS